MKSKDFEFSRFYLSVGIDDVFGVGIVFKVMGEVGVAIVVGPFHIAIGFGYKS